MLSCLLVAMLLLVWGCQQGRPPTLVAAAISLRPVMLDLGDSLRERHRQARIQFHFASSGVLLQQARQGAPFDVVVFAGDAEMKRLEDAGEVQEGTQHVFASNRLILAVPQGGRSLHRLEELREPAYARIGMGDPDSVPAGRYAEQVLRNSGLWSDLQPRLVFTAHAAQTVEYLQRGEVDAAFLYHTDAVTFPWLDVALEVDPSLHGPIRYTSALVTDAPDPRGGQRFLDLLNGSLGQVVLRKHGFGPPAS